MKLGQCLSGGSVILSLGFRSYLVQAVMGWFDASI